MSSFIVNVSVSGRMISDFVLLNLLRRNEYVPKVPSCNSALLVALLLNHVPGTPGLTKEKLMVLAEETGVAGSESLSGDGGYSNGWSGMSQMLLGDPALVRKEKGQRFSLTTQVITHLFLLPIFRCHSYSLLLRTPISFILAARDKWTCYCKRSSYSRS